MKRFRAETPPIDNDSGFAKPTAWKWLLKLSHYRRIVIGVEVLVFGETIMKRSLFNQRPRGRAIGSGGAWASTLATLFMLGLLTLFVGGASAAVTAVPLGTADSFAVLAGAGITNTGPTTINGDFGTFPTTSITGSASITTTGTNHAGDSVTQGAKTDLVTAYNTAAGEGPTSPIVADLGGQTLTPGVYNSASSIGLTGSLTLNGGGDPDAVFVFQAGSTLTTASASSVNLVNGAQACNVFWQIGSDSSLGTGSTFRGTLIGLGSITVTTGVTVDGRVLARNGAVTLDTDTITRPTCTAPTTTTTTATTTTTTTTTAPTPAAVAAVAAATAAANQAAVAETAENVAVAAQTAALTAAAKADVTAATAAAAKAAAAATKARVAATAAAKFAAAAKVSTAKVAAAKAATAAAVAKAAAVKAAAVARLLSAKPPAAARPASTPSGFTG